MSKREGPASGKPGGIIALIFVGKTSLKRIGEIPLGVQKMYAKKVGVKEIVVLEDVSHYSYAKAPGSWRI